MTRAFLLTLAAAAALPAAAQPAPGSCEPGTAEAVLDGNAVTATLFNGGNLFFGNASSEAYVIGGTTAMFAANVWFGGVIDGEVRTAGATYSDFEFWPGPLGADGRPVDPDDCSAYDRIYTVSVEEIAAYEAGGSPAVDLAEWPVRLGAPALAAPGNQIDDDNDGRVDEGTNGADDDGDGRIDEDDERERIDPDARIALGLSPYSLVSGDRPDLSTGEEAAFWVMNDAGNDHSVTGSDPLGIEIRAFVVAPRTGAAALNQTTVYRYEIVNRSAAPIDDVRMGIFTDPVVNNVSIGTDTSRAAVYAYGPVSATDDHHARGPIILSAPLYSSRWMLNASTPQLGDPRTRDQYWNALNGEMPLGGQYREGGLGSDGTGPTTLFAFPGDPLVPSFWSQRCLTLPDCDAISPANQRMVGVVEVGSIAPGASRAVAFAYGYGRGASKAEAILAFRASADALHAAFGAGDLVSSPLNTSPTDTSTPAFRLSAPFPNPATSTVHFRYRFGRPVAAGLEVYDVLGRRLLAQQLPAGTSADVSIDVAGWASGVYSAVLKAGDGMHTRRFTVVH